MFFGTGIRPVGRAGHAAGAAGSRRRTWSRRPPAAALAAVVGSGTSSACAGSPPASSSSSSPGVPRNAPHDVQFADGCVLAGSGSQQLGTSEKMTKSASMAEVAKTPSPP